MDSDSPQKSTKSQNRYKRASPPKATGAETHKRYMSEAGKDTLKSLPTLKQMTTPSKAVSTSDQFASIEETPNSTRRSV